MGLRISNVLEVQIQINSLDGRLAMGGHLLRMSTKLSMPAHSKVGARLANPFVKLYFGPHFKYIGRATAEAPFHMESYDYPSEGHLLFDLFLSKASLEELEQHRNGGDLPVFIDFYASVFDGVSWSRGFERIQKTFNQREWIKALEEMNYGTGLVFEVPLGVDRLGVSRAVDTALRNARAHLYDGNYRAVISDCRTALEPFMPDSGEVSRVKEAIKNGKESLSKRERMTVLLQALRDYMSLSVHLTTDEEYQDFTRSEAIFVLGASLGVMSAMATESDNK